MAPENFIERGTKFNQIIEMKFLVEIFLLMFLI